MTIAEFILKAKATYNQHVQTEISEMHITDIVEALKEMEDITCTSFTLELWSNQSGSIYELDAIKGDNKGDGRKLWLSIDKILLD